MAASSLLRTASRDQATVAIDEDHLARMTLGDRGLEREVLQIFARQTVMILERIACSETAFAAAAAHTLKGSARGVGAWRVAQAAERVEEAAGVGGGGAGAMQAAIVELEAASLEARAAIGARLSDDLANAGIATAEGRRRGH